MVLPDVPHTLQYLTLVEASSRDLICISSDVIEPPHIAQLVAELMASNEGSGYGNLSPAPYLGGDIPDSNQEGGQHASFM